MRPNAVDHKLWKAIEYGSTLDWKQCQEGVPELDFFFRQVSAALQEGANPDAQFPLSGAVHLSCVERGVGQLKSMALLGFLERVVQTGWKATDLPTGLWAVANEKYAGRPGPDDWYLDYTLLRGEPSWMQVAASYRKFKNDSYSVRWINAWLQAEASLESYGQQWRSDDLPDMESFWGFNQRKPPFETALEESNLAMACVLAQAGCFPNYSPEQWAGVRRLWEAQFEGDTYLPQLIAFGEAQLLEKQSPIASRKQVRRSL